MSEEIKPAYGLVQINITNQAEFMERYAQHVFPILEKWGIEMIAGSDTPVTKEGTFKGNCQRCCASQAWLWQRSGTTQMTMLHTETSE